MPKKPEKNNIASNAEIIMPPSERRQFPRIIINTPVYFSVVKKGGEVSGAEEKALFKQGWKTAENNEGRISSTVNISSGGVLMDTQEKIEKGAILHLTLNIPLPGLSCTCSILSQVVRCDEDPKGGYNTAVQFIKVIHHNLNKQKYMDLNKLLNIEEPDEEL